MSSTRYDKNVVSEDSGAHIGGASQQNPRPSKQRKDHHAERASLGDAFGMVVLLANVTSEAVVNNKVLDARNVWSQNAFGKTSFGKHGFDKLKNELVKTFVEVSGGPSVVMADDFEVLSENSGGIPSVFS